MRSSAIAGIAKLCYEPCVPASYQVDKDQRWVHTMLWGEVSLRHLLAILERGFKDPDVDPIFSEILDLTEVTQLNLSADDIRVLAQKSPFSFSSRRAFVVPDNDAVFGLVRMYEILREFQAETGIQIFRTLDEALCWVAPIDKSG